MRAYHIKEADTYSAVKELNHLRLSHKGEWFQAVIEVGDIVLELKNYNTWHQIARINGVNRGGQMGLSITEWKELLTKILS